MRAALETATSEHPLPLSDMMSRALRADRKTMTRRVASPQDEHLSLEACPYGRVGDVLWVREAWRPSFSQRNAVLFRSDGEELAVEARHASDLDCVRGKYPQGWRPPMFMPRWACRDLAQLTSIRLERVQQITESDSKDEGSCVRHAFDHEHENARDCFHAAWKQLNSHWRPRTGPVKFEAYPWTMDEAPAVPAGANAAEYRVHPNPLVWCLTFERIDLAAPPAKGATCPSCGRPSGPRATTSGRSTRLCFRCAP